MIRGVQVNSRGHQGSNEESMTWIRGVHSEQGTHESYTIDLVRNRKNMQFGRRIGRGMDYETWLANCCGLMLYLTGHRWKEGYNWHRAYHKRKLDVAEAVHEAIGREELEYDEDVPIRSCPATLEEALEEVVILGGEE